MTAEVVRRLPIEIVIDAIERGLTTGSYDLAVTIIDNLEAEGWELDCVERPEKLAHMSAMDRRHQATCNWNLYAEQRPDPDLCNLECLNRPHEVAAAWAYLAWQEAKAAEQAALAAYNETLLGAVNERNKDDGWEGPHLCCVLAEDNGSFCGQELPCPDHGTRCSCPDDWLSDFPSEARDRRLAGCPVMGDAHIAAAGGLHVWNGERWLQAAHIDGPGSADG